MTTQPKRESESGQSNQNHHGPFYRSAELVTSVHRAEGGMFEGFRAARGVFLGVVGKGQLQKVFAKSLKAIEARDYKISAAATV